MRRRMPRAYGGPAGPEAVGSLDPKAEGDHRGCLSPSATRRATTRGDPRARSRSSAASRRAAGPRRSSGSARTRGRPRGRRRGIRRPRRPRRMDRRGSRARARARARRARRSAAVPAQAPRRRPSRSRCRRIRHPSRPGRVRPGGGRGHPARRVRPQLPRPIHKPELIVAVSESSTRCRASARSTRCRGVLERCRSADAASERAERARSTCSPRASPAPIRSRHRRVAAARRPRRRHGRGRVGDRAGDRARRVRHRPPSPCAVLRDGRPTSPRSTPATRAS